MKYTRRIFFVLVAACLAIGLFALAACRGGEEDPEPEQSVAIDYTVTVACDDEEVLGAVKVQLFSGMEAATAEKPLDSAHKATFSLAPAAYSVKLTGAEGYTYPETTLTKEAPAATVSLTAVAIDYTVTVACDDEEVLGAVKVQLFSGTEAATSEKPLDGAHKATFSLAPATYSVKLTGADGYTYPETTLTKEAPAATVSLTAVAIDYTVTVACDDEEVLGAVKVQLFSGTEAATSEKPLDGAHKATFSLAPATYSVKLTGADGYTYPETTLTKEAPAATVELSPLYTVTYAPGSYRGEAPSGVTLPKTLEKTEGERFALAAALVWSGYTFRGWTDGTTTYAAGASYEMPAQAVTLTALWSDLPQKEVRDENVTLPEWDEGATEGGYTIQKGEYIEVTAKVRYKETDDSSHGILVKIFPNSVVNNDYFYQFRCDFAIKRNEWSWVEDNSGFTVTGEGWDRDAYKNCSDGTISIRIALDGQGTLTYTFEFTAGEYSGDYHHKRVFTDQTKMNSAVILLGTEKCQLEETALVYPFAGAHELTLDFGENWESGENTVGGRYEAHHFTAGETFTFPADPFLYPYDFVGWQKEGGDTLYHAGDTFKVGETDATFVAVWRRSPTITIDRNGGSGDNINLPARTFDEETGKYVIGGLPVPSPRFSKRGYTFAGWETTVNGVKIEVDGPFSVDPDAVIVFKALWE